MIIIYQDTYLNFVCTIRGLGKVAREGGIFWDASHTLQKVRASEVRFSRLFLVDSSYMVKILGHSILQHGGAGRCKLLQQQQWQKLPTKPPETQPSNFGGHLTLWARLRQTELYWHQPPVFDDSGLQFCSSCSY